MPCDLAAVRPSHTSNSASYRRRSSIALLLVAVVLLGTSSTAIAEAPPDPKVVGPRLIREESESQLTAWRSYYAKRLRAGVEERWTTDTISETDTVVTLQLVSAAGRDVGAPARWALNFALTRPLTEAEQERADGPHGIEALDARARRLSSFPPPRLGQRLPVRLFAEEVLSPGNHELIVSVAPRASYEPNLLVRDGIWDEALSRGEALVTRAPRGLQTLALADSARFREQDLDNGRVRPSSIYRLARLFNSGPVLLLLGWRTGAQGLAGLLRRPIEEVVILS